MVDIRLIISNYYVEFILGLSILPLLLLIYIIVASVRTRKLIKNYNKLVRGIKGINIEDLLIEINQDIDKINKDINFIEQKISQIETKLSFAIRRVGFMRYNAFDDMGSQLSFSLALLDDFKNGIVLTSIYGREDTVTYCKEIKDGTSNIPLSAEEIIVLERAVKGEYSLNI